MAKKFLTPINILNLSSDPVSASEGDIYYNTDTDKLRIYANGSWTDVSSVPSQAGNAGKYLATDGTNVSWESVSSGSIQTDVALSNSWWLGV